MEEYELDSIGCRLGLARGSCGHTVLNLQVPQNAWNSLLSEELLAHGEGFCFMVMVKYNTTIK
jgi:hypothetical protein